MSLFVILYVWQNIEIMKIELEHKNLLNREKQLVRDNDYLLYEIELYRRMDVIQDFARKNGLKPILPEDFDVMIINENNAQ
jgi:hypothetical protein